ncbi:hypothetical protein LTR62_008656 [Meristemomyces frigidus]|uniref:Arrestin-like N-terminal domain-containing protein n=1 Tax=Meristemomyces frigidus TaxID=1508187 RepID=A0AAN7THZ6_9PEZI|nr:hypothetical protein LTR62_008656 [Meristemomyces frigidus]
MPTAGDRSTSSLSSPLSGRRIISRIASPFSPKSRSIGAFSVEVDDPHRQYSPGDIVKGSVRLRVLKPSRVTHVVVSLHGYVQVFKNPGSPGEGFRANNTHVGTGRGKKSGEYFGNGFASLFEDEVVLCGDGRLAEGSYQFNFELQFPDKELPSSIDFERGTISYMISATMTRPTTMSPTTVCDQKVFLLETIDISPIYPPKPRTIMLEPLSRRSRAKTQARKLVDSAERRSRRADSSLATEADRSSVATSFRTATEHPISPAPSEVSFDSARSSNGPTSTANGTRPSVGDSDNSRGIVSRSALGSKTITATVEPETGGCLRGDSIKIKVNVFHTKSIKSLYGVIATLYRQARVDMHPAIPLGPMEKGLEKKYEDYYPKSLTGLGGLSLSGAGSNHLFRKDLTQTMVPLYVDPTTLEAEVSAKVRVPDAAFPTISCVPGAMISFKYFVEVIVDIQGRLGSQDRSVAGLNLGNGRTQMTLLHDDEMVPAPFGSSLVDTAPIRRDKGVVTCTFEIIVGTRDSARRKGKRRAEPELQRGAEILPSQSRRKSSIAPGSRVVEASAHHEDQEQYWYNQPEQYHANQWPEGYDESHHQAAYDAHYDAYYEHAEHESPPPTIPIPILPDESQLPEKERIRRAEARLLPSAPPGMPEPSEDDTREGATAPYLGEDISGPSVRDVPSSTEPFSASGGSMERFSSTTAPAYQQHEAGTSSLDQGRPYPTITLPPEQPVERRTSQSSPGEPTSTSETSTLTGEHHDPRPTSDLVHHSPADDEGGSPQLPRYER